MLFLFRKPPFIKWHIIAPSYQKPVIDLFLDSLEIKNNRNQNLETITYINNSLRSKDQDIIAINNNYGKLDTIQSYIFEAGIYFGWLEPKDYLVTFNERNHEDGLKWISELVRQNSLPKTFQKKLLVIYPESGMGVKLSSQNKDYWPSLIEFLSRLIDNKYFLIINQNPNSYHGFKYDFHQIESNNIKVLDINIDSIVSLANLNCEMTIVGFRSGIHDMTRWMKQCRLIELYLPTSRLYNKFNLNKLSSYSDFITVQMNNEDSKDPKSVANLILEALTKLEELNNNK